MPECSKSIVFAAIIWKLFQESSVAICNDIGGEFVPRKEMDASTKIIWMKILGCEGALLRQQDTIIVLLLMSFPVQFFKDLRKACRTTN